MGLGKPNSLSWFHIDALVGSTTLDNEVVGIPP